MTALLTIVCGLAGLLVGSFLNVVIWRVPRKQSVVRPRSHCPSCDTELAPPDLVMVPLALWFAGSVLWFVAMGDRRSLLVVTAIAGTHHRLADHGRDRVGAFLEDQLLQLLGGARVTHDGSPEPAVGADRAGPPRVAGTAPGTPGCRYGARQGQRALAHRTARGSATTLAGHRCGVAEPRRLHVQEVANLFLADSRRDLA